MKSEIRQSYDRFSNVFDKHFNFLQELYLTIDFPSFLIDEEYKKRAYSRAERI
jgi:hypothetical protein